MLKLSQSLGVNTERKAFNINSVAFDGTDEHIDCGDNDSLSFTNGTSADTKFSVSLWVNFNSVGASQGLVGKISSGHSEYFVKFHSSNYIWFRLFDTNSGGKIGVKTTGITFAINTWYHVAATYDGGGASSGMNMYIDGIDRTSRTSSGSYSFMDNTSATLTLGLQKSTSQFLDGVLDEVMLWQEDFSISQVRLLYNSGYPIDPRVLFPSSTLRAYWRMGDDSVYPTIVDSADEGLNDGTMQNMVADNIKTDVPQQ